MVYQDISEKNRSEDHNFPDRNPVPLLDRVFSFFIDLVVFFPFVSFFQFILFKEAWAYLSANPSAPEKTSLTLLSAFFFVASFSLFQAVFIRAWRATPGQYYLKISLVFENGSHFILWRSWLRQLGFCFSFVLFGLPFLSLLYHPFQQAFYDRLAECHLVTKKRSAERFSFENERRYWRSFAATLMAFFAFIVLCVGIERYGAILSRQASYKVHEKNNFFCKEVKDVADSSRLELALAMNLVGQLSDDCLDREADFVLWKDIKSELSLAYFAKSMNDEKPEVEQRYQKQACLNDSETLGCRLATAFRDEDFENLYGFLKTQDRLIARVLTYEFSLIYADATEQDRAFSKMAVYQDHRLFKKYFVSEILSKQTIEKGGRSPASEEADIELQEEALEWVKEL